MKSKWFKDLNFPEDLNFLLDKIYSGDLNDYSACYSHMKGWALKNYIRQLLSSVRLLHHDFTRCLSQLAQTAIMKLKKARKHPCRGEEKYERLLAMSSQLWQCWLLKARSVLFFLVGLIYLPTSCNSVKSFSLEDSWSSSFKTFIKTGWDFSLECLISYILILWIRGMDKLASVSSLVILESLKKLWYYAFVLKILVVDIWFSEIQVQWSQSSWPSNLRNTINYSWQSTHRGSLTMQISCMFT